MLIYTRIEHMDMKTNKLNAKYHLHVQSHDQCKIYKVYASKNNPTRAQVWSSQDILTIS